MSAFMALEHPYLKRFHNPAKEPARDATKKGIDLPLDDNKRFEIKKYREELYKFIEKRNK